MGEILSARQAQIPHNTKVIKYAAVINHPIKVGSPIPGFQLPFTITHRIRTIIRIPSNLANLIREELILAFRKTKCQTLLISSSPDSQVPNVNLELYFRLVYDCIIKTCQRSQSQFYVFS